MNFELFINKIITGKTVWLSLIIITIELVFMVSCGRQPPTINNSTLQESYGTWMINPNSPGFIPFKVIHPNPITRSYLERKIQYNLYNPNVFNLIDQGLFNRPLINYDDDYKPWSAGYFPSWQGGLADRWRTGFLSNLFGHSIDNNKEFEVIKILAISAMGDQSSQEKTYKLSPIEKYDLVMGDYSFKATKWELSERGGNGTPGILQLIGSTDNWDGYCNGVALASTIHMEPFRKVKVINSDGYTIIFHPYDIKGLLALAYYYTDSLDYRILGKRCRDKNFSIELQTRVKKSECRGVNPASFILMLQNRLKIARASFIIDVNQGEPVSNMAIGEAQVDILKNPGRYISPVNINESTHERLLSLGAYPLNTKAYGRFYAPGTEYLLNIRIKVWLGNNNLETYESNKILDEKAGVYQKVGFRPNDDTNPKTYYATLELNNEGTIIGGEWGIKDRSGRYLYSNQAPDFVWYGSSPLVTDQPNKIKKYMDKKGTKKNRFIKYNKSLSCRGDVKYNNHEKSCNGDHLVINPNVRWSVIKAIYQKSILSTKQAPQVPLLDLIGKGLIKYHPRLNYRWKYRDKDTNISSTLHLSYFAWDYSAWDIIGYTEGIDRGPRKWDIRTQRLTRRNKKPLLSDIVRAYGYAGKSCINVKNLSKMIPHLVHLDDYEIYKSNISPMETKRHFRLSLAPSNQYTPFNYFVLFFYRYFSNDTMATSFKMAKNSNGREKPHTEMTGLFMIPMKKGLRRCSI